MPMVQEFVELLNILILDKYFEPSVGGALGFIPKKISRLNYGDVNGAVLTKNVTGGGRKKVKKGQEGVRGKKGSSLPLAFCSLGVKKLDMSRPLRIEYPGAWYHVMNRGRRRENIFLDHEDYEAFIQLLQETDERWSIRIAAYCLMPNHYHLLVHTPAGNLSRCMRHINGVYTQRFNRSHNIDGQLFRGRYKAVLIDADSYLLEVLRYIHRNPLRAGLVEELPDYAYISHHGYVSTAEKWKWLKKDMLLAMLNDNPGSQRKAYIDFVSQNEPERIAQFYTSVNLPSVLGSNSYRKWVKEKFKYLSHQDEIPKSRDLAPTAVQIVSIVCRYFRVEKDSLVRSRRGMENLPRDVAIYLVRLHTHETLAEVGQYFSIRKYSTVSSAFERVKNRQKRDGDLQRHLEKITAALNVSEGQSHEEIRPEV